MLMGSGLLLATFCAVEPALDFVAIDINWSVQFNQYKESGRPSDIMARHYLRCTFCHAKSSNSNHRRTARLTLFSSQSIWINTQIWPAIQSDSPLSENVGDLGWQQGGGKKKRRREAQENSKFY